MEDLTSNSGRTYSRLPIDARLGFPQSFPMLWQGQRYHFRVYVNAPARVLADAGPLLDLPDPAGAFLVVQIEREQADGGREPIFLRKVLPELEYEAGDIAVFFPEQHVAKKNLNGTGDFGSAVTGGIRSRWA